GYILRDYFKNLNELPTLNSVDNIFIMACDIHSKLKEKYYLNPNEDEDDSYESSRMEYLIANQHGIFGVDSYRYVEEYTKYSAYGSGYMFALGAMNVAYELNYTAEEIARFGLEASAEYDDGTDKPFHIYKIENNNCMDNSNFS
ncbi:MAG: hypothetical protein Q8900_03425, partial [Bacillota bacterium]|nr:hypothetical protein [Bacillota bacterium]